MKRKNVVLFVMMVLLIFVTVQLQANSQPNNADEKKIEEVIDEYVQKLGNDWERVAALFVKEKEKNYLDMLNNNAVEEHIGMFNIISAILIEKKEVTYKDVNDNLNFEGEEKNIRTFVIGVDYEVYENTPFYAQGTMYTIMAFVREENEWKIEEVSLIENPEDLEEKGYKFKDDYKKCIRSMENRKQGLLTDGEGRVFDRVCKNVEGRIIEDDTEMQIIENKMITNEAEVKIGGKIGDCAKNEHTSYSVPTSRTMINYAVKENGKFVVKYTKNFNDFCLGCTTCEVGSSLFDGVARRANVIAIKTFVWHYYIVPMDVNAGYNLNNIQIAYKPYQDVTNVNINRISNDVSAVKRIWMESASGKIFAAYFKKGEYNGNGKNGGELKQDGSRFLAANGYSETGILHYYYDNSSASQAGPVQFFYTTGEISYK